MPRLHAALAGFARSRIGVLKEILGHPLSDSHFRTLWRYGKWNLFRLGFNCKVVMQMPGDLQLIVPNRANFSTGLFLQKLYDLPDMAFFCHFLSKGDLFADIGANVGVYGLLAAQITGCRLIACEPAPDTFAILTDNARLNRLDHLAELHNVAVGEDDGEALLTEARHGLNHIVGSGGARVPVRRLDELVGERPVAAVKIDVEGYELRVLRGASRLLANPALKAVKAEINGLIRRYDATEDELRSHLTQYGFAQARYDPIRRLLSPGKPTEQLWVRDYDFVSKRLIDSPVLVCGARRF
jgi:FkbM family methyltransferase